MKKKSLVISIALFLILALELPSQEIPLTGFVFDQTKTRIGREFYDAFTKLWESPEGFQTLNLTINEFSDPRWGTQIYIYVEDTLVYITPLKPRLEDIEEKAEEALEAVLRYFIWLADRERALKEEIQFF